MKAAEFDGLNQVSSAPAASPMLVAGSQAATRTGEADGTAREGGMARMRNTPDRMISLLRQIETAVANGKPTQQACLEAGIVSQTYYRWRRKYGGMQVDLTRRVRALEQENARLKQLVSELSLEKLLLKEIASGKI
jgi:putative transposase